MDELDPGRPLSWTWYVSRVRFDVAAGKRLLVTGAGLGSLITLVLDFKMFRLVFLDVSSACFSTSVLAAARRHSVSGW